MKKLLLFFLVFVSLACQRTTPVASLAVYYWRTSLSLTPEQEGFLTEQRITKLYVRYCDVGLRGGEAVPIAPIEMDSLALVGKQAVPVIYLKNEVFLDKQTDPKALAAKVGKYIEQINNSNYNNINKNEIIEYKENGIKKFFNNIILKIKELFKIG